MFDLASPVDKTLGKQHRQHDKTGCISRSVYTDTAGVWDCAVLLGNKMHASCKESSISTWTHTIPNAPVLWLHGHDVPPFQPKAKLANLHLTSCWEGGRAGILPQGLTSEPPCCFGDGHELDGPRRHVATTSGGSAGKGEKQGHKVLWNPCPCSSPLVHVPFNSAFCGGNRASGCSFIVLEGASLRMRMPIWNRMQALQRTFEHLGMPSAAEAE